MVSLHSLFLGCTAIMSCGAQAADLPAKTAAPVEYVRVCTAYDEGFFYVPGTDSCLRVWLGNVVGIRCLARLRSILGALTACDAELLAAGGCDALHSSQCPYRPAVRIAIARSTEPTGVLARRFGVSTETLRKWRKRGANDCQDHSSRTHKVRRRNPRIRQTALPEN
jgi:hypothetical protein